VQDEQVDLVDTELAGALVEGVQRGVVAVVADPDLGLDEHVGPAHARAADALADLALVGVGRRGVDEAVPDAKCSLDRLDRLLRRGLEDAEAEGGHHNPVVQDQTHHAVRLGTDARPGEGLSGPHFARRTRASIAQV
jgi:hypothetical protein